MFSSTRAGCAWSWIASNAVMSTYRYAVSLTHCMSVSLGLGGAGLGTMWGRQLAVSMLTDAGFTDVEVTEIEQDPSNYYYLARK